MTRAGFKTTRSALRLKDEINDSKAENPNIIILKVFKQLLYLIVIVIRGLRLSPRVAI